jgi:DNA-binding transcriptional regulator YdaS (Cro superfamily)
MKLKQWIVKTEGMSQREFASRLGIGEGHLNRWLMGLNIPSLRNAIMIEKLTNGEVTAEDLLPVTILKSLKAWYRKVGK